MDTISEDSLKNILSFLEPIELCQTRILDSDCKRITDEYLMSFYGSIHLNNYVCPSCGRVYEKDNEITHSYFYDLPYGDPNEEDARLESVQKVFRYKEVQRVQLLCDNCDSNEIEIAFTDYVKNPCALKKKLLPYAGDRNYQIRIFGRGTLYPWTVLFYSNNIDDDDVCVLWNEYRSFVDMS